MIRKRFIFNKRHKFKLHEKELLYFSAYLSAEYCNF